jgi:hypothetical protein
MVNDANDQTPPRLALERLKDALGRIEAALGNLRYGTVTVVVQDGVVVQVERTERIRLDRPALRRAT